MRGKFSVEDPEPLRYQEWELPTIHPIVPPRSEYPEDSPCAKMKRFNYPRSTALSPVFIECIISDYFMHSSVFDLKPSRDN